MNIERFNMQEWNATLYSGRTNILNALKVIEGKTIERIKVIGAAFHVGCLPVHEMPFTAIDFSTSHQGVPTVFEFTEPVSIYFTDGTTIEILPKSNEEWYVGNNSIPKDIVNGININNLDTDIFLHRLKGIKIVSIASYVREITRFEMDYENVRKSIKFTFNAADTWSAGFGFSIEVSNNLFYFALTWSHSFYDYGNRIEPISRTFRRMALRYKAERIEIMEGCVGGFSFPCFEIMPVKLRETNHSDESEYENGIVEYTKDAISIEDDDVLEYLSPYLDKYYNRDLSLLYRKKEGFLIYYSDDFEWYNTHNIFSYEDISNMLKEMSQWIEANTPVQYDPENDKGRNEVDFYVRFVKRMKAMMEAVPVCSEITFKGP